jgi:hypothetical protein
MLINAIRITRRAQPHFSVIADRKSLSALRDVGPEFEAWGAVVSTLIRFQIGL